MVKCLACAHRKKIQGLFYEASLCDVTQRIMSFEDVVADYPCKNYDCYKAMKDLVEVL